MRLSAWLQDACCHPESTTTSTKRKRADYDCTHTERHLKRWGVHYGMDLGEEVIFEGPRSPNGEQSIVDDDDGNVGAFTVEDDSSIVTMEDPPPKSNTIVTASRQKQLLIEKAKAQAQHQKIHPTASSSSTILIETNNLVSKIGGFEWFHESSPYEHLEPLSMPPIVTRVQQLEKTMLPCSKRPRREEHNASELLFETEGAIECFLPIEIDYHHDEIDGEHENKDQDQDYDEIIRIRNSFRDHDSLSDDDDDDDDTLSCQSPIPMEPSTPSYVHIHDPKFQQAMDNFAVERHGFDHLVGEHVEGARTGNPPVSSSRLSVVHEEKEEEEGSQRIPPPMEDSRNLQQVTTQPTIVSNMFYMEQVTLNDRAGLSSFHSLIDEEEDEEDVILNVEEDGLEDSQTPDDLISATAVLPPHTNRKNKKTRRTTRQVLFACFGDDNTIRTEMLGPPIKPASEMSKTEKKTLWWSNSDYRCFRKDFMCSVEDGFDTGFMCSPFRSSSVNVATARE